MAAPRPCNYYQRLQYRVVAFVSSHSQITAQKFQALMLKKDDMAADVGSVVYGEEAVSLGIIDQVGGLSDGLQCLYRQIEEAKGKRETSCPQTAGQENRQAGGLRAPRLSFISSGSVSSPVRPPSC